MLFENGAADYTVASRKRFIPLRRLLLLFHSNGILSFRSDDCRVKLRAALFNVPIWNTFRDPDQLPTARIPHDGMRLEGRWGEATTVLKNLESALNRLNGIPSYETFLSLANSSSRIHGSLGIPPGLCSDCRRFVPPQYYPSSFRPAYAHSHEKYY